MYLRGDSPWELEVGVGVSDLRKLGGAEVGNGNLSNDGGSVDCVFSGGEGGRLREVGEGEE